MFTKNTLDYFRKALVRELRLVGFKRQYADRVADLFHYSGAALSANSPLPEDDVLIDLAVAYYNQHKHLPTPASGHVEGNKKFITWAKVFEKLREEQRLTIHQMVLAYETEAEKHDLIKKTNIPILLLPTNRRIAEQALHYKIRHGHLPNSQSGYFYEEKSHYKWGTILDRLRKERNLTLGNLIELHASKTRANPDVVAGKKYRSNSNYPDNEKIAKAAIQYRNLHGKLPTKSAGPVKIKKCNLSWRSIHIHLQEEQRTTLATIVKKYEQKIKEEWEEKLKPKEGMISARAIFTDAATFIKDRQEIPDANNPDHKIAGKTVKSLNYHFRENCVAGYRFYLRPSTGVPKNLNDFLVYSGMAERKNGTVRPANAAVIDELIQRFG